MISPINLLSSDEIRRQNGTGYSCPGCVVQTASSKPSIEWVECPMIRKARICLGCCFDFQDIVRNYPNHAFSEDLDKITKRIRISVEKAQSICLSHQKELLEAVLIATDNTRHLQHYRALMFEVEASLDRLMIG